MSEAIRYKDGLTISLPVKNMSSAIDWYEQVLGCKLKYRMDEIGWCELDTPIEKVSIGLSQVEELKQGDVTPTLGVEDIKAAKALLESKAVKIDGDIVTIENMVHLLTFYDLDNNSLMFFQLLDSNE